MTSVERLWSIANFAHQRLSPLFVVCQHQPSTSARRQQLINHRHEALTSPPYPSVPSQAGSNTANMSSPSSRIRPAPPGQRNAMRATYDFIAGPLPDSDPNNDQRASPQRQRQHQQGQDLNDPKRSAMAASTSGHTTITRTADPPDADTRLRAELGKAQYELVLLKQDRELERLRHEKSLTAASARADAEWQARQAMETERNLATRKLEALSKGLAAELEATGLRIREAESRTREAEAARLQAEDEARRLQEELDSNTRAHERQTQQLGTRFAALQRAADELNSDLAAKVAELQAAQKLASQTTDLLERARTETSVLRASLAEAGDVETIRREFGEQIRYVSKLEIENRAAVRRVKRLEEVHRAVELVEEQKRDLERKVQGLGRLREEFEALQLAHGLLESEKAAWKAYLERVPKNDGGDDDAALNTPEGMARALAGERMRAATLLERLGRAEPELMARDLQISRLEEELEKERARQTLVPETQVLKREEVVRGRLERQRALAVREVEFLRAHLRVAEGEGEGNGEGDEEEGEGRGLKLRVQQLEALVDDYRVETATLTERLSAIQHESGPDTSSPEDEPIPSTSSPLKRRRLSTSPSSDLRSPPPPAASHSALTTQLRTQSAELSALRTKISLLETDLSVGRTHLSNAQAGARRRVLQLRENPTLAHERTKKALLEALRAENEGLRQLLDPCTDLPAAAGTSAGEDGVGVADSRRQQQQQQQPLVPRASLEVLQQTLSASRAELAQQTKRAARLRQIYGAKALEFREAVASLLGYRLDFLPSGRVRVTAVQDVLGAAGGGADAGAGDGEGGGGLGEGQDEEGERSIVFDGGKGTMKVAGGKAGVFGREIRDQMRFWVEQRGEIPCFLASLLLENFDRSTRAGRALQA